MAQILYLTAEEILFIHYAIMEEYGEGEQAGIFKENEFRYLEERPQIVNYGEEACPSMEEKAAAYFHSICRNHVFFNGNKRTALVVMNTFLEINGYQFEMSQDQAEEFTVEVAKADKYRGNDAVVLVAAILKDFIRKQ